MTNTLIASYVGQGLAANRPGTPLIDVGAMAFYYATDTGILSSYVNGAWTNVVAKQLIASQALAGVANFTFSSIPTGFKDLELRVRGRCSDAVTSENLQIQFNGDTGNNYDYQQENRFGLGTGNGVAFAAMGAIAGASATANYDTTLAIDVFNYGSANFKAMRCYEELLVSQTAGGMLQQTTGGWWRSTAAITSIKATMASGNITGSASLYGIPG
jgi:hypothetical protein